MRALVSRTAEEAGPRANSACVRACVRACVCACVRADLYFLELDLTRRDLSGDGARLHALGGARRRRQRREAAGLLHTLVSERLVVLLEQLRRAVLGGVLVRQCGGQFRVAQVLFEYEARRRPREGRDQLVVVVGPNVLHLFTREACVDGFKHWNGCIVLAVNYVVDHHPGDWNSFLRKEFFKKLPVAQFLLQACAVIVGMHLDFGWEIS